MNPIDIVIIVACALVVAGVIAGAIVRKKRGKRGGCGSCSSCPYGGCRKNEKERG